MLSPDGLDSSCSPLYPICQCSCGLPGRKAIHGDLELVRFQGSERYELAKINCPACKSESSATIDYLPSYFSVRFNDLKSKGIFKRPNNVYYKGYYMDSIIQYNKELRHFRCLKLLGPVKVEILDGGSSTFQADPARRKHEI